MKKFMGMKKLMSVIFVFLLSACATTQHVFLTDIKKPSNEDLALMKTELTILRHSTAEGEMIKPFILQTLGLIEEPTPEGVTTYKHLTRAAQISRMVRECRLTSLKPATTLPQGSNIGRVWSLAEKLPIEIHIFTLGDHHIIKLDQTKEKERQ